MHMPWSLLNGHCCLALLLLCVLAGFMAHGFFYVLCACVTLYVCDIALSIRFTVGGKQTVLA